MESHRTSSIKNSLNIRTDDTISYPTTDELKILSDHCIKYRKTIVSELLLPFSSFSHFITQTFMLNKYEVNCIYMAYLSLWRENPEINYVPVSSFRNRFCAFTSNICSVFFESDEIYYDSFFQFVCIILFLNPTHIMTIILSHSKIHSNICITQSQINMVLDLFEGVITKDELHQFQDDYNLNLSDCEEDVYSIKPFIQLISESPTFESILNNLKLSFIYRILDPSIYSHIIHRQMYYINNPAKVFDPPKEPCIAYIQRILFTHEPPPYHFDYILSNISLNYPENLILTIKYIKGYGNRCRSSLNKCTPSRLSRDSSMLRSVHMSHNSHILSSKKNNRVYPV